MFAKKKMTDVSQSAGAITIAGGSLSGFGLNYQLTTSLLHQQMYASFILNQNNNPFKINKTVEWSVDGFLALSSKGILALEFGGYFV